MIDAGIANFLLSLACLLRSTITPRTVCQDCVEPRSASGRLLDAYLENQAAP
jgi:hypothetical protein